MNFKAEVFDKFQYLSEVNKFNDHTLHGVIRFEDKLNIRAMEQAMRLLLKVVPILSSVYREENGSFYWESVDYLEVKDNFIIVDNEGDFNGFITEKINEMTGPQIKACLFTANEDSLAIVMNHMICDAAGFKQSLYLLGSFYSELLENFDYSPEFVINGDRGFKKIIAEFSLMDRLKALLFQRKDSNQNSSYKFPMSEEKKVTPFFLTHEISQNQFAEIRKYCKINKVTVNDIILAAYYRVLYRILIITTEPLNIPIMVDMRRNLKNKDFMALSNLSSTVITNLNLVQRENFYDTVTKINQMMNIKKAKNIGLNGFVKLDLLAKIFSDKTGYKMTKRGFKNPLICMTNIGVLDSTLLKFKGASINNAFMFGSVKYRPYFQLALSSFADKITFTCNLYGSHEDRNKITSFFSLLDKELSYVINDRVWVEME
ncbi:WS/DGAT domain-containing protein [Acetobacterium tundrae]|uniref:DUF1298 domain-containing protein n=1 Tax=Acetobacterium tundrae TaxID=132932 RepID=A0ABR6WHF5_9FIRM|nr:WS/DGAT domain-containing protein [Acetobacterium tundrae]MBC3795878.1 DUF1298 domain-containing protein [Acetobacterium tundrae]